MGVFDSLISQKGTPSAADTKLLSGLVETLARVPGGEGLKALTEEFHKRQLDALLQSWMGNNVAEPLSAEQLQGAVSTANRILTPKTIADLTSRCGLNNAQTIEHMAQLMPTLVRALTPRGELPSETIVQVGLESLRRELLR